MKVLLSPRALTAIEEIWRWNARTYSVEHADRYVGFLRQETQTLATTFAAGRPVPARPNLLYITIRRSRRKGHGHVAVYEVRGDEVYVLDYFHTAQDRPSKL